MKKKIVLALIAAMMLTLAACGGTGETGSFDAGAYDAAYINELTDEEVLYSEISDACNKGIKTFIAPDSSYMDAVYKAAGEFKDVNFIQILEKNTTSDQMDIPENVAVITFDEFESGYLAGYAAIIEGYSNFGLVEEDVDGNHSNKTFAYGVMQGINDGAAGMGAFVRMYYIVEDSCPASESAKVEDAMKGWFDEGFECMFICGDEMGQFMLDLTEAGNGALVGTHAEDLLLHERVITASARDFDKAAEYALKKIDDGKWNEIGGKATVLGVAEGVLYIPTDDWRFDNFTIEQYEAVCDEISAGNIVIADDLPHLSVE